MKHVSMVALMMMGMAVAGCATTDVASRNAPFEAPAAEAVTPSMQVVSYEVRVPKTLKVSEANSYYPNGDIVWRGEPLGDRYAQVRKIFEDSLARGAAGSKGAVPVVVDIEVTKFHALSEKTRYTIGGRHEIHFTMNFLNPQTMQPVAPARKIDATFKGFGGARAIHAEQNGFTQRVRIVDHLTGLFQKEFGISAGQPQPQQVRPIPVNPDVVSRNAAVPLAGDVTAGLY